MLDSLLDGLKGQVANTIAEKTGINMGMAEQVVPTAKDSIMDGVMGAVKGGNINGVLGMLQSATGGESGGLLQNALYQGIAGNLISNLTSKIGIPAGIADQVSGLALPAILSKIGGAAQAAGDTDEIDQASVMSAMGLDAGGLLGKLAGGLGGDAGDVAGKIGGIAGKLGGLFGK